MREPIAPMLATLVDAPPQGREWVFEEKYDGIRLLAYRRRGRVRLWSRNGIDNTAGFAALAGAIARLPGGDLVFDGEAVAFDRRGVSRFQLLQRRGALRAALRARGPLPPGPLPLGRDRTVYVAFDCLELRGREFMRRPLRERREALVGHVPARGRLMRSRRLRGDGLTAYRTARRLGWEGIIAKQDTSIYEPGRRSRAWLKVKVRREAEFVVGGFTPPGGSRLHLGALLVGLFDAGRLRYVGKVGTGFTGETLRELRRRLEPLRIGRSPFDPTPRERDATWVRPRLVAQLAFAEWTADGKLRQPAFLGLRSDKPARVVTWSARER